MLKMTSWITESRKRGGGAQTQGAFLSKEYVLENYRFLETIFDLKIYIFLNKWGNKQENQENCAYQTVGTQFILTKVFA